MGENKQKIGEIEVEVKAKLSVDESTFYTCMRLIAIHAKDNGLKGMVLRFEDYGQGYSIRPLMTDDAVEEAFYPGSNKED